jgi:hypothetical protein
MGIERKGTRDELADGFNLVIRDRGRVPIDPQNLNHANGGDDGQSVLVAKAGEAVSGEQGKADSLPSILPSPAAIYEGQKGLETPRAKLSVDQLFVS